MLSQYEQFQKENSSQISKLEFKQDKQNIHTFNSQLKCNYTDNVTPQNITRESLLRKNPFGINKSCVDIDTEYNINNNCIGYECDKNSFYHQPEKRNTFHNYLVMNDNNLECTENHQYFNNWTKRNNEGTPFIRNDTPLYLPNDKLPEIKLYECNI